jgi:hypothetical protein
VDVIGDLLAGTLSIVATFAALTAAFVGVGILVRRAFGPGSLDIDDCFLAFWVGFGAVTLGLIVWNFFGAIGFPSLLVVLSAGAAGLLVSRRALVGALAAEWQRQNVWSLLSLALAGLWLAHQATGPFVSYDGGLYHLQGVQWASTYPVVPGIANLHGPLGFNNSSFLYDAMLDSGWWDGGGFHIANGTLLFAVLVQAIVAAGRFTRRTGGGSPRDLYSVLLLAPALYLVPLNGGVTSYSTDLPLTLILLVATARVFSLLDIPAGRRSVREDAYAPFALVVLLATAVSIKVTAAVFAGSVLLLAGWLWWRRSPERGSRLRTLSWMAVAAAAFAAAWVARGVVMSGYPLFPLTIAGLPVDWRAPLEHGQAEFAYLAFTEREFTWSIVGWDWLELALWDDAYAVALPAALAVTALAGRKRLAARRAPADLRLTWWMLLPVAIALASWLFSAPSTRYAPALFWTAAAVCVCEWHRAAWPLVGARGARAMGVAVLVIGVSPLVVNPLRAALERGGSPFAALARHNFVRPSTDWFGAMRGEIAVAPYETGSGLVVNTPSRDSRGASLPNACWNAPIPCTPNPAPNLALREAGQLRKGFKVEGDWAMRDWPYYWTAHFLDDWRARRGRPAWGQAAR